jgi:hypothetical protein
MNSGKRKFTTVVNKQKVLIIDMPDRWIKAVPLDFPGSGLHIYYNDNTKHHYDVYDEDRHKKKDETTSLRGFETGTVYACSGQTVVKIEPGTDVKVIPQDQMKVETQSSGNILEFNTNSPGCIVYIRKKP